MRITNPRSEKTSKSFEIGRRRGPETEDPTPKEGNKLGFKKNLGGIECRNFGRKRGKEIVAGESERELRETVNK